MPFKNPVLPSIYFTVTNDLSYDQRMIRICTSLAKAGFIVTLVGRKMSGSIPLRQMPFKQKRLYCFFEKGKLFYAEYNLRLFFYLLFKKMDGICAIDLDTIIPCYYISKLNKIKRILDAHEYFSQQKEVLSRKHIYKFWQRVEKKYIPLYPNGYTVGSYIAASFRQQYGVTYEVIRNLPVLKEYSKQATGLQNRKIVLYQGAVNESRGLEYLIPAMKNIDAELHIYGDGNFMDKTKKLIAINNLESTVFIKGKLLPDQLDTITSQATIGINLVENTGLNQYYSLANKFFDFIQHEIPQVTMKYPEYEQVNNQYEVAVLISVLKEDIIKSAINRLLKSDEVYDSLRKNCGEAKKVFNWQLEEKKLVTFYKKIFG